MRFTRSIPRSLLTLGFAAAFIPALAHADTFTWTFASMNVSGSGTLTAVAYGSPGEFLITGGAGSVTDTTYGTFAVALAPCATPAASCTLDRTGGRGAPETYDDLLFPEHSPDLQLDGFGVVLTPGPAGTVGINIYDGPPQEFYGFFGNGNESLSTPFTVTPFVAATPEPTSLVLVGSGLLGIYHRFKRRNS